MGLDIYTVEFTPALGRLLRNLPPSAKRKVRDAFRRITGDPSVGKALIEELQGLRSYRIGKLRIIYRLKRRRIEIVTVGPRRSVYKTAALAIKRGADAD